eukprot:m.46622 g.46622  ORF g.46622 m.46622 type:complete len:533 (-) comp14789_c0_seq1:44-1642(-)
MHWKQAARRLFCVLSVALFFKGVISTCYEYLSEYLFLDAAFNPSFSFVFCFVFCVSVAVQLAQFILTRQPPQGAARALLSRFFSPSEQTLSLVTAALARAQAPQDCLACYDAVTSNYDCLKDDLQRATKDEGRLVKTTSLRSVWEHLFPVAEELQKSATGQRAGVPEHKILKGARGTGKSWGLSLFACACRAMFPAVHVLYISFRDQQQALLENTPLLELFCQYLGLGLDANLSTVLTELQNTGKRVMLLLDEVDTLWDGAAVYPSTWPTIQTLLSSGSLIWVCLCGQRHALTKALFQKDDAGNKFHPVSAPMVTVDGHRLASVSVDFDSPFALQAVRDYFPGKSDQVYLEALFLNGANMRGLTRYFNGSRQPFDETILAGLHPDDLARAKLGAEFSNSKTNKRFVDGLLRHPENLTKTITSPWCDKVEGVFEENWHNRETAAQLEELDIILRKDRRLYPCCLHFMLHQQGSRRLKDTLAQHLGSGARYVGERAANGAGQAVEEHAAAGAAGVVGVVAAGAAGAAGTVCCLL